MNYVYNAGGQKLSVTHRTAIAGIVIPMTNVMQPLTPASILATTSTDYCGNVIYENGVLSKILTEEGYITLSGATPMYHYFLKDHQGNNRVVINQGGTVEQVNHYYPFGGLLGESMAGGVQPYKYNGKELDRMHGLDLFDYGARHYDAALGKWLTVDPLAEKYYSISPYVYVVNNPVRFIDPDGMDIWEMDYWGNVKWIDHSEQHTMYALNKKGNRTEQSITIKDRSIFDGLATTGKNSNYTKSYSYGNPSELASVFLFGADNSNAEWRFSRYNSGNGDQYAIGTVHKDNLAISPKEMGFSNQSEIAFIHSHPSKYTNTTQEYGSMGWRILSNVEADFRDVKRGSLGISGDSQNVKDNSIINYPSNANYLTYFPYTGNIYQVRGAPHPAFIRNIKNHNNNPKTLFWGILNGK